MPEDRWPVVIVGGGIAGLSAAYALKKRGVRALLLEADQRPGGVIRTEIRDGFQLELGPDSILAQKPEGLALCRELGLGDRLTPTNPHERSIFVLRKRRLHTLPEGMVLTIPTQIAPFATSRLFSWPGKLRMGAELLIPPRREQSDESIASFMLRRFGREALTLLGEPLLAGIHSGAPERLSMRSTFPRFLDLERRYGSLIRGILATRPRPRPRVPPAVFYSLRGGLLELARALEAQLATDTMLTSVRIQSVARDGRGFALRSDDGRSWNANAVIVATPARHSAPVLEATARSIAEDLRRIPFVSTAIVFLAYGRADVVHPLHGYGFLSPKGEGLRTAACTFFSTKYPGSAPEGMVLLRGFLGGARDPEILSLPDDELVGLVRRETGALLGISAEPLFTRVHRWPQATPQMEVGHLERIAALDARLAEIPGLFLTGAGLRSTGIPDGVADATRTAESACAYLQQRD
jgi:protoporphyrinogen/coproporphyrinogen III oxidase